MEIVETVGWILVGLLGFIDGHLGVTIAFLGLAITWYRVSGEWRQSRELNLRIAYQNFSSSQAKLDRGQSDFYPGYFDGEEKGNSLVTRPEWCYSGGRLVKLDSVTEVLSEYEYEDWVTPSLGSAGLLPYRKWDLATNVKTVLESGPGWSARTYAANSIAGAYGDLTISMYEGEYFDFYNTCFGMGLLAAFQGASRRASRVNRNLRRKIHEGMRGGCSACLKGRFALVAVSCVTVVIGGDKEYILLHQRSAKVVESKSMLGIVPAGSHQTFLDAEDRIALLDTVKREFAEELLGVDEAGESPSVGEVDDAVKGFVGPDNVYFLGIGINPVQAYVQVLAMCVVDQRDEEVQKWLQSKGVASVEEGFTANFEGDLVTRPFTKGSLRSVYNSYRRTPCLGQVSLLLFKYFEAYS